MTPTEGEAGLSSAITFRASRESTAAKSRTGEAAFTPYLSAVSGRTRLRRSTSARRASRMRSRTVPVLGWAFMGPNLYARESGEGCQME